MANDIILNDADKLALAQMVYGENAGEDSVTQKMTAQSAINRLASGRSKEFGATLPEVLKKGYYAVSKNSPLYKQAVTEKFPDVGAKAKFYEIKKLIDAITTDKDYGKTMFYFRPEEEAQLKKGKKFNFDTVKPTGRVGPYNTYGY